MDPNGHIYRDVEEKIPAEDKARLEGYLIAREEQDATRRLEEKVKLLTERHQTREGNHG